MEQYTYIPKFKLGDRVRVVNRDLSGKKAAYLGLKGIVVNIGHYNYAVLFKDGNVFNFSDRPLELAIKKVKIKRIKFDLERALKGDEVITRYGRQATGLIQQRLGSKPLMTWTIDGVVCSIADNGRFVSDTEKHPYDLFMKHAINPLTI